MKANKPRKKWSQRVTRTSNALTLDHGVFSQSDPKKIARSLLRSANRSRRRKSAPGRSAMSMLTFYVNRAGRNLPRSRREILERAKEELRTLSKRGRPTPMRARRGHTRAKAGARKKG